FNAAGSELREHASALAVGQLFDCVGDRFAAPERDSCNSLWIDGADAFETGRIAGEGDHLGRAHGESRENGANPGDAGSAVDQDGFATMQPRPFEGPVPDVDLGDFAHSIDIGIAGQTNHVASGNAAILSPQAVFVATEISRSFSPLGEK